MTHPGTTPDPPAPADGAAFDPPARAASPVAEPGDDRDWTARRQLYQEAALAAERATGAPERNDDETRRNLVFRFGTIVVGFVVLFGGIAMMVLPGPGILGVLAGLGILSRELPWAERMMEYVKKRAKIDELKQQPKWVQAAMWTVTAVAVIGSMTYFIVIR